MSRVKAALERLPRFFRFLIIIGIIALISLLFPSNIRFNYEFELNQSWSYETLDAPFDFAIKKSEVQYQEELANALKDYHPFYLIQDTISKTQLNNFGSTFRTELEKVKDQPQFTDIAQNSSAYRRLGEAFLGTFFEKGIIKIASGEENAANDFIINVIDSLEITKRSLGSFYTVEKAQNIIRDSLTNNDLANADFLLPILIGNLKENVIYQDSISKVEKNDLLATVVPTKGMVNKGDLIISRGAKINEEAYLQLNSLKTQYEKNMMTNSSRLLIFIGYFLLTSLIISVFVLYLKNYAPDIFNSTVKLLFVFMWLLLYSYLVTIVEKAPNLNAYLIPFSIIPIVITTFYNPRLALFTHIMVVLIASFLTSQGYEFTFLHILAGIVVLLTEVNTRNWTRFFSSILFIFFTYALGYFSLSLIKEGQLTDIDYSTYSWLLLNVILTLLAYPLIPLLERFFGFTSEISLIELSDMNKPLLRKLAIEAPGTLQHSLQVANLSEAAAQELGANALLVKVAALYHDVGKTKKPEFFIENQSGENPHNQISELDSAKIIIGHVSDGIEMARKARLPKLITQFIKSHHGTTRVEYFYRNYLKNHPDEYIDESIFRYPGPKPQSKEETILMLADSIEAACKSLKNPTEEELSGLIDKIISGKISSGQLQEAQMTFEELEKCKSVFKLIMKSVHHVRIEYPDDQKKGTK